MSNTDKTETTENAISIRVNFAMEITPVTQRISRYGREAAHALTGAFYTIPYLEREAARLDRLALRNERAGKTNGANSNRARAAALRRSIAFLLTISHQIEGATAYWQRLPKTPVFEGVFDGVFLQSSYWSVKNAR